MQANKKGRPTLTKIKSLVNELRKKNLSFTEIGKELGMKKQTARYHYLTSVDKKHLTQ